MSNGVHEPTRRGADGAAGVQSVDRAVTVLEILARKGSAGVSEIALEIGVHKSTAFRLLGALEERELVEQNQERGKYQLGFGVLRLASAMPGRLDLVRQARPVLDQLAARIDETVNLAVLREHYAVNVDQARGSAAVASQNWTGQLTPLHATSSGKVLLAAMDEAERSATLDAADLKPYTEHTVTSRRALEEELRQVRDDGFATTYEELEAGLNAVAVPVRDHSGEVVGAVSASGPAYRFHRARIESLVAALKDGGERISHRMGHLG